MRPGALTDTLAALGVAVVLWAAVSPAHALDPRERLYNAACGFGTFQFRLESVKPHDVAAEIGRLVHEFAPATLPNIGMTLIQTWDTDPQPGDTASFLFWTVEGGTANQYRCDVTVVTAPTAGDAATVVTAIEAQQAALESKLVTVTASVDAVKASSDEVKAAAVAIQTGIGADDLFWVQAWKLAGFALGVITAGAAILGLRSGMG